MVLEQATSINSIFEMMSTSMQLTSENQHILNSHRIKYGNVQDDNAEKLYLRLRAHYALAAPKAGAKFGGKDIAEDVKINELCELMLVEKTLEKITAFLPMCRPTRVTCLMKESPFFVLKGSSGIRWMPC